MAAMLAFDDDFGNRDFTDVGLLGGLTFDNRDNQVDATEGYFLEALAEPFYEFKYGNAAAQVHCRRPHLLRLRRGEPHRARPAA